MKPTTVRCVNGSPWQMTTTVAVLLFCWLSIADGDETQQPEPTPSRFSKLTKRLELSLERLRKEGKKEDAKKIEDALIRSIGQATYHYKDQLRMGSSERGGEAGQPRAPLVCDPLLKAAKAQVTAFSQSAAELGDQQELRLANRLRDRIKKIETGLESGNYQFKDLDRAEVHWVAIARGTVLPKEYHKAYNRFKTGFAEVHVKYTARPVVLYLTAADPVLWKIRKDRGVRIFAIAHSPGQEIVGLEGNHPLKFPIQRSSYRERDATAALGSPIAVTLRQQTYQGEPIVIGPSNPEWLARWALPELREIRRQAIRARFKDKFTTLDELRFQAVYTPSVEGHGRFRSQDSSVGVFNYRGPVAETLRPLPYPNLTSYLEVPRENATPLRFGLTRHHDFVVLDSEKPNAEGTKVPRNANTNRIRAMAYDSKRNRLVLSTDGRSGSSMLSYDLADSTWGALQSAPYEVDALVYDSQRDVYFGYVGQSMMNRGGIKRLLEFTVEGELKNDLVLESGHPDQQQDSWSWEGKHQLIKAGEFLVLIHPGRARDHNIGYEFSPKKRIRVIDPESGIQLYTGEFDLHTKSNAARTMPGEGPLGKITRKTDVAEELLGQLHERGEFEVAERLAKDLSQLRAGYPDGRPTSAEEKLMLVGFYDPHSTHVHVSDKTAPIILALCTYESGKWTITADEGVTIAKIIVSGYEQQEVLKSPQGVEVITGERFQTYGPRDNDYQKTLGRLRDLTGRDVAHFFGAYRNESDAKIELGPRSGSWQVQEYVNGLDRIAHEATAALDDSMTLRRFRFFALHQGPLPGVVDAELPGRGTRSGPLSVAQFSIEGPLFGRGFELPQDIAKYGTRAAFDPTNGRFVFRSDTGFRFIDADSGQGRNLPVPSLKKDRLNSWAIDPEGTLFVSSNAGLQAINIETGQAKMLVPRRDAISGPMVYVPREQAIYSAVVDGGSQQVRVIRRYNRYGAVTRTIALERPVAGVRGHWGGMLQLVPLSLANEPGGFRQDENYLALLAYPERDELKPSVAIVNIDDGSIVYEGRLVPHAERRKLNEQQLERIWSLLLRKGTPRSVSWELAAGHDVTVQFLKAQFSKSLDSPEKQTVENLVKSLGSDKFATRDEAFKQIAAMGSSAEPIVVASLPRQSDTETRHRLRELLKAWKESRSQNPEERRLLHAVDVLATIDLQAARDLLNQIKVNGTPALRRRAASALE